MERKCGSVLSATGSLYDGINGKGSAHLPQLGAKDLRARAQFDTGSGNIGPVTNTLIGKSI
jgi:hypothetical protein